MSDREILREAVEIAEQVAADARNGRWTGHPARDSLGRALNEEHLTALAEAARSTLPPDPQAQLRAAIKQAESFAPGPDWNPWMATLIEAAKATLKRETRHG